MVAIYRQVFIHLIKKLPFMESISDLHMKRHVLNIIVSILQARTCTVIHIHFYLHNIQICNTSTYYSFILFSFLLYLFITHIIMNATIGVTSTQSAWTDEEALNDTHKKMFLTNLARSQNFSHTHFTTMQHISWRSTFKIILFIYIIPLLFTFGLLFIPLQPPLLGVKNNYMLFIHIFLVGLYIMGIFIPLGDIYCNTIAVLPIIIPGTLYVGSRACVRVCCMRVCYMRVCCMRVCCMRVACMLRTCGCVRVCERVCACVHVMRSCMYACFHTF